MKMLYLLDHTDCLILKSFLVSVTSGPAESQFLLTEFTFLLGTTFFWFVYLSAYLMMCDWILDLVYASEICRLAHLRRTSSQLVSPLHRFYNLMLAVHFSCSIRLIYFYMHARVYHSTGVEVRTIFRSGFLPCTYISWGWNLAASTLTHWAILLVLVSIFSKQFCVVCLASVCGIGRCNTSNPITDSSLRRFLFHSRTQDTRDPWKNTVSRESVSGKGWRWKQAWSLSRKEKAGNSRNNLKYAENRTNVPVMPHEEKALPFLCAFLKSDG